MMAKWKTRREFRWVNVIGLLPLALPVQVQVLLIVRT